jgi:hypothetical protein
VLESEARQAVSRALLLPPHKIRHLEESFLFIENRKCSRLGKPKSKLKEFMKVNHK